MAYHHRTIHPGTVFEDEVVPDSGSGSGPKKSSRRAFAATVLFGLVIGVLAIFLWPGHGSVNPILRFAVGMFAGSAVISLLIPFVGFFEYRGLMKGSRKRRDE